MRHYDSTDEYDIKTAERLKAKSWMLDVLAYNPEYVHWGNHEDYMMTEQGWRARAEVEAVKDLWGLDELNELVNFYFMIDRNMGECDECDQTGLNPATKLIDDGWYAFDGGIPWKYSINEYEVLALMKAGRLNETLTGGASYYRDEDRGVWRKTDRTGDEPVVTEMEKCDIAPPTADQVNEFYKNSPFGHDAINKAICVQSRAEQQGVYGECEHCKGHGSIYVEEECRLALQMWFIHPRKGCSRGVILRDIKQEDLSTVFAYLKEAEARNTSRFAKLPV